MMMTIISNVCKYDSTTYFLVSVVSIALHDGRKHLGTSNLLITLFCPTGYCCCQPWQWWQWWSVSCWLSSSL